MTSYGIPNNVQEALSKIRTDLDSFHDAEAYALMYSAYKQTCQVLDDEKFDFIRSDLPKEGNFNFKKIRAAMEKPHLSNRLVALLNHSSKVLFKWYHVAPLLQKVVKAVVSVLLLSIVAYAITVLCAFLCSNSRESILTSLLSESGWLVLVPPGLVLLFSLLIAGFWILYLAGPGAFYLQAGRLDKFLPDCDQD
jgi:hypothetical protein